MFDRVCALLCAVLGSVACCGVGAGEKIENTLDAFRHAVHDTKTDILELDLHLTKDKQVFFEFRTV